VLWASPEIAWQQLTADGTGGCSGSTIGMQSKPFTIGLRLDDRPSVHFASALADSLTILLVDNLGEAKAGARPK
jgi:hypothetical protein